MSSLVKNTATGTATTDMDKKRADLMAALTANQGAVSGGVSNKKTETIAPASPDTKDKGAVVSAPVYKQPQAETGVAHPTSAPKSTQVNYTDPTGAQQTGYLINGTTYTDPDGKNPVAVGSTVTLPNGDQWHKGANGSYQVSKTTTTTGSNYSDLSPLINQSYDKGDQMIRDSVNYQTQQGVDQLNRALQDAQPNYAAAIANQLLEAKQAQDAKAYRNQINGDRGGIGSAQVDSIGNTGARNREAIAQQQRQLATDTARQIADLRAQGKYEEASQLLQNNQARLSDLYNEQVRLQSEEQRRTESLAALGQSYMSAGLMPNKDMLAALGIDEDTAKLYIDLVNAQQTGGTTGGSTSDKGYTGNLNGDKVVDSNDGGVSDSNGEYRKYVDLTDHTDLSPEAKEMYNKISTTASHSEAWKNQILTTMANRDISLDEGMFLCKVLGISRDSLVQYIADSLTSGAITEEQGERWLSTLYR